MNVTANERIVLNMIARNLYQPQNGARPEGYDDTSDVWSNCLDSHNAPESLSGATLSAVCGSLAKKGLVRTYDDNRTKAQRGHGPDESTIALTESGFAAWLEAFPPSEDEQEEALQRAARLHDRIDKLWVDMTQPEKEQATRYLLGGRTSADLDALPEYAQKFLRQSEKLAAEVVLQHWGEAPWDWAKKFFAEGDLAKLQAIATAKA